MRLFLILFLIHCLGVSKVLADRVARLSLNSTYSTTAPVGASINIYLPSGTTGCTTPTVAGPSSWSISPTPYSVSYSGNNTSITVKWTTAVEDATVSVYYHCSAGDNGDNSNPFHIKIKSVTPSLDVAFDGGLTQCGGGAGVLKAVNVLHEGSQPVYSFFDGSQNLYSSGSSSFNITNLTPGGHNLSMTMLSSETGTSVTSSNVIWVNVLPRIPIDARIYVNGAICPSNPVAKASVNVTGGGSPYKYTWYYDGYSVATTYDGTGNNSGIRGNYYDYQNVAQGKKLKCKVESLNGATNASGCTEEPFSDEYTVVIDSSVPSIGILTSTTELCENQFYDFTPSKQGSSYSWKLYHSNELKMTSTSRVFNLQVTTSTDPGKYEYFTPNSMVTLEVDGLASSGCASNTTFTAFQSISASSFAFHSTPDATLSPSGNVVFCTTCVPVLTASTGPNYSYQWFKNYYYIPNYTSQTLTTDIEDSYRVQVSDAFCTAVSSVTTLKRNTLPTVNAGPDQRVALPLSSLSVPSTANDAEGPLVYAWTQIYDSNSPVITLSGTNTPTLVLTDLFVGVYRFRLTVTDNTNESRFDEIKIIIDPPNNYNYVKENILNVSGITDYSDVASIPIGSRNETVHYVDGLGRTLQTVASQESPLRKDIVQPAEYDEYGREKKKFLPYVANEVNGWYKVDPLHTGANYVGSPHFQFYQNGSEDKIADDSLAYAETTFEASPLNRPDKQYGAGINWHAAGKYIQHSSLQNDHGTAPGQEQIIHWIIDTAGNLATSSVNGAYYPSGTLSITSTQDEHGNETREYVDSYGRMICRKVQSETTPTSVFAETYYVYDDLGNLTVVLPPESVVKMKNLISQN